MFKHNI